tara:strand:- start:893 stop:3493 length:2601 start_codon:yes stop_codon:yes gene_type:complete
MTEQEMFVIKRNGTKEEISFDKILQRVKKIGETHNIMGVNFSALCLKVIDQLFDEIETKKIDELTAQQCASMTTVHPDYGKLASCISISNHQKNTYHDKSQPPNTIFKKTMTLLYENTDYHGKKVPLISKQTWDSIVNHEIKIQNALDYDRDYLIDYFGFKTLERAYLMKINGSCVERPQDMWMRVSIGIHGDDIDSIIETYDLMSRLYFTHATPTLFNSGTPRPQLSSCFLLSMVDDSINGIFDTLKECAQISKWAGGIGIHVHNIRAKGTQIRGTNGTSNGLVPMLKVFNDTARYVDQGGGKRNGSFAIYLEPIHPDIEEFLELRKNQGDEESKARDLFYALWIPDIFMKKIAANEDWCLFCPDKCPGFSDCYGEEYEQLYEKYEKEGKYNKKMPARELWFKILDSQMETGTPYLLYKDACNKKSNQNNIGTIKSSNLCTEIIEYSSPDESAVCNLASVAISRFVTEKGIFDYEELHKVVKIMTKNLNKIIDINYYPTDKTKRSNFLHRPIGIGIQGLADAFILMDIAYDSEDAKVVNKNVFETIYHATLESSNEIAKNRQEEMLKIKTQIDRKIIDFSSSNKEETKLQVNSIFKQNNSINKEQVEQVEQVEQENTLQEQIELWMKNYKPIHHEIHNIKKEDYLGAYSTFEGSPASRGELQFDLWGETPSDRYDWAKLKNSIQNHGLRNSLCVAPMPTASTSQILGNNECFEPFTSNIYTRRTLAGEFIVVNKYLIKELVEQELWNEDIKNNIISNKGSVQYINGLSSHLKEKYKTVWEMPMKQLIDMARDRGQYICQSQSLNLWLEEPNYKNLTSMHFYSWKAGLKTGIYYLRRKPRHQPQQFTIKPKTETYEEEEECEMCGS